VLLGIKHISWLFGKFGQSTCPKRLGQTLVGHVGPLLQRRMPLHHRRLVVVPMFPWDQPSKHETNFWKHPTNSWHEIKWQNLFHFAHHLCLFVPQSEPLEPGGQSTSRTRSHPSSANVTFVICNCFSLNQHVKVPLYEGQGARRQFCKQRPAVVGRSRATCVF
jgi:hypothetical protein